MKKSLLIGICFLLYGCQPQVVSIRDKTTSPETIIQTNEVVIRGESFVPDKIKIKQGETVSFTNLDNEINTLVSDPHPSHSQFIDLYKVLHLNETYNYQFNKIGIFGVHLEENTSVTVKIVVE